MEDERCQRRLSFETTFRTEKELGIIKSLDPQMIWHPNFGKYGWQGTARHQGPGILCFVADQFLSPFTRSKGGGGAKI